MKPCRLAAVFFQRCGLPVFLLLYSLPVLAQSTASSARQLFTAEQRTTRALENARANPLELHAFLVDMPTGADLHNHLSGAVYAESWIRAGAEDGLCVNLASLSFVKPQQGAENPPSKAACDDGRVPAAQAFKDQHLYDALVDAFSMRGYVPSPGITGHDQFFSTFDKFGGTERRHKGEWLDEVATRAAAQNEQYLEIMETPEFGHTVLLSRMIRWNDDFSLLREALLKQGLRDDIKVASEHFDQAEAVRKDREHCGQSDATPACNVEIRYLYQVLRGFPKEQVFAQTLIGFEIASNDPRVVGI